jgi:epoxyqueuosine reductase
MNVREKAKSLGFQLVGVAPLGPFPESMFYPEWLKRGYAGEMRYLERQTPSRMRLESLLPGAKSVVVCAMNYNTDFPLTHFDRLRAWISRYAWGSDYHEYVSAKLKALGAWMEDNGLGRTRTYVDTGPVPERVLAKYAGIGWFGRNTCIINEKVGSWLFLGCILSEAKLDYDNPAPDRCGTCTRCIDACPTDAIVAPYVLDSRKCISYLTIELRGDIPESQRSGVGHHLFGCDICQDVCPWNRKAAKSDVTQFQPSPDLYWPELDRLLDLDEAGWRSLIRGTALKRAKVVGLIRNLLVVAGNSGPRELLPRISRFLAHADNVVRRHAQWAVERLEKG